jgi:hypothetical protein
LKTNTISALQRDQKYTTLIWVTFTFALSYKNRIHVFSVALFALI